VVKRVQEKIQNEILRFSPGLEGMKT